jgi:hypothetical protein
MYVCVRGRREDERDGDCLLSLVGTLFGTIEIAILTRLANEPQKLALGAGADHKWHLLVSQQYGHRGL